MTDRSIPFLLMRGGTSKGLFLRQSDLPTDRTVLAEILMAVVGTGQKHNVDGIGSGDPSTTGVAILKRSIVKGFDIEFFYAQVGVVERTVDYKTTCSNVMAAIGPASVEIGLIEPSFGETSVSFLERNYNSAVRGRFKTPDRQVQYEGTQSIDGVPGTASPVYMEYSDFTGKLTGTLLPLGRPMLVVDGVPVTCIDAAIPMCVVLAKDLSITGYESCDELNALDGLTEKVETIRNKVGELVKLNSGECLTQHYPEFAVLAPARFGATFSVRYYHHMRWNPRLSMAAAKCLAASVTAPGSVGADLVPELRSPFNFIIEVPDSTMNMTLTYRSTPDEFAIEKASCVSTARLIAKGELMVPSQTMSQSLFRRQGKAG